MTDIEHKEYRVTWEIDVMATSPEEAINRSGHWRVLRGES
jgi:hypothetical protein